MAFEERLFIMSGEQTESVVSGVETLMGDRQYSEITDHAERIGVLCELNNKFEVVYGRQSEPRQDVIADITDTIAHGALRAILPPNRRNASLRSGLAVGTVHRGLVQRSRNFSVGSRTVDETLLLNGDASETAVSVTQSAASGYLIIEGERYNFARRDYLLDILLTRNQDLAALRIMPLSNLAIFASACSEATKGQNMQTVTNLIALMANEANTKAV